MTTPYYADPAAGIWIYHGDYRKVNVHPLLNGDAAEDVIAATITDPPYGTGYYEHDRNAFGLEVLEYAPTSALFGWPELLVKWCVSTGQTPSEWITWWPPNGATRGGRSPYLVREAECIAIFGDFDADRIRVARNPVSTAIAAKHGKALHRRLGDVWTDSGPACGFSGNVRLHPNEKPMSVVGKLVALLSEPGEIVFDPFMGSGTTLAAAKAQGRRAIGIDIDERHCEVAAGRLEQGVLAL